MSLRLRLQRHGANKRPFYRLVAADQRAPRDGRYREQLGTYNPMVEPNVVDIDMDRVNYWLGVGAQPTERVKALIKSFEAGQSITNAAYVEQNKAARQGRREAALSAKEYVPPAPPAPAAAETAAAEAPAEEAPAADAAEPAAEGEEA